MQILEKLEDRHFRKLYNLFFKDLSLIQSPKILEFGVSNQAMSTEFFIKYCESNNGILYSVDVNDFSKKFKNSCWNFIHSRDDNFSLIDKKVPNVLDIIYLDTIHKADHIEKIFYHYYPKLSVNGYFLIDDISWLPYTKISEKNQFYMEINNEESFLKILEIYFFNRNNFDLEFSFIGTGLAKIKKINNNKLSLATKIPSRKNTIFNFLRKFIKILNINNNKNIHK